jgi:hypothetical protein
MRTLARGKLGRLTVTLLHGARAAHSAFERSASHEPLVAFRRFWPIDDPDELLATVAACTSKLLPGRGDEVRRLGVNRPGTSSKATLRRCCDAMNTGDAEIILKTIDELVTPGALIRPPMPGPAALRGAGCRRRAEAGRRWQVSESANPRPAG